MTENEAIKELKDENEQCYEQCEGHCSEIKNNICTCRDATILFALEQYRAMERRLQKVYGVCDDLLEKVVEHLERHDGVDFLEPIFKARLLTDGEVDKWELYKAIGTVEECQEARERQKGKKPIKYGDARQGLDNDGNSISWQEDCYECPTCGSFLGYVGDCNDEQYQDGYCRCCGQSIAWSDTP